MTGRSDGTGDLGSGNVQGDGWTLVPVQPEERPLLERLGELYLYDFTGFASWDVGENGMFDHEGWGRGLWADPSHTPLLLRVGGKPAGFAIVSDRSMFAAGVRTWYLAEFFVMRRYRQRGNGASGERWHGPCSTGSPGPGTFSR